MPSSSSSSLSLSVHCQAIVFFHFFRPCHSIIRQINIKVFHGATRVFLAYNNYFYTNTSPYRSATTKFQGQVRKNELMILMIPKHFFSISFAFKLLTHRHRENCCSSSKDPFLMMMEAKWTWTRRRKIMKEDTKILWNSPTQLNAFRKRETQTIKRERERWGLSCSSKRRLRSSISFSYVFRCSPSTKAILWFGK